MPATASLRALLFDLGGVVLAIDAARPLAAWQAHSRLPPERLRERFGIDEPYCLHETGRLDDAGWFAHVRERLELDCEDAAVCAGWNALLVGEIAETAALIDQVRTRLPCYALSNTNGAHLAEMRQRFPTLLPRFDRVFASHEIGHRKPSPQAFHHVLREIGASPPEVLFFDDLPANVDAARALGLQAVLVQGPADVRGALAQHGLV